jgi:hypothetical protein
VIHCGRLVAIFLLYNHSLEHARPHDLGMIAARCDDFDTPHWVYDMLRATVPDFANIYKLALRL